MGIGCYPRSVVAVVVGGGKIVVASDIRRHIAIHIPVNGKVVGGVRSIRGSTIHRGGRWPTAGTRSRFPAFGAGSFEMVAVAGCSVVGAGIGGASGSID